MEFQLVAFTTFVMVVAVNTQQSVSIRPKDSSFMNRVRGQNSSFQCKDVKDLKHFANCAALKRSGNCDHETNKMQYYCPITCKLCEGAADFKVPSPPEPKCKTSMFGCCKDGKTEAKGEDSLGCPERCVDLKDYQCPFYTKIGFCKFYKRDMLKNCPLSCGYCKPYQKEEQILEKPKDRCEDIWQTKFCEKLKSYKLCDSDKWDHKMSKKCKKTCGKCAKDAPLVPQIAMDCAKDNDCCWDKSRPVDGKCPANACRDDIVYANYCKQWQRRGECEKYPDEMSVYCPKTCKFCQ